jgi:hypothetical protein
MSEPVPFTTRTKCIKCGEERAHWNLALMEATGVGDRGRSWVGDPYVLDMRCDRCGFRWTMRTMDYRDDSE